MLDGSRQVVPEKGSLNRELHTRDVISIGKMSHKLNKELSHLGQLSPGMRVNTRYINSDLFGCTGY